MGEPFRSGAADASGGDPEHKPLTFCFKPLANPSSKRVQLLPSHENKDRIKLNPVGRMSLSLIEEGERQNTHSVATVGICTGEITKGRPTLCVPSPSLYKPIVLFVPWAVNSLLHYPCHILRDMEVARSGQPAGHHKPSCQCRRKGLLEKAEGQKE